MLARTYAALKAAGVSDEQAQAAAGELGSTHQHVGGLGHAVPEMHADIKGEISGMRIEFRDGLSRVSDGLAKANDALAEVSGGLGDLRGRFDALIWVVGINAAATIAILGVLLRHQAVGREAP